MKIGDRICVLTSDFGLVNLGKLGIIKDVGQNDSYFVVKLDDCVWPLVFMPGEIEEVE